MALRVALLCAAVAQAADAAPLSPSSAEIAADARDVHCAALLTLTSNPSKRQIGFTMDDTRYVALVTIVDVQPKLVLAH